jgi:hypothetical protein
VYRGEEHLEGEVWDVRHPVNVFDETGQDEIRQRPGGHYAELYARYTNLDASSDVGLALHELVFVGEYQGIKAV